MPPIAWIQYTERVVARGSPGFVDVDNRPLRQIVELHGHDPDDLNFPGLHHFPSGVYTNDIYPYSGTSGLRFRSSDGSNNLMEISGTTLKMYFAGGIDFSGVAETGWSLGSGGTQKGGLIAGTDTLTTTQQVVNAIVALLVTKFKLAKT